MSLTSRREQIYPPPKSRGLHCNRTEIYIGRQYQAASGLDSASGMQPASGFNDEKI